MVPVVLASWMSDSIIEAFEALIQWVITFVSTIFDRDLTDWDVVTAITFAGDSIAFLNYLFPMTDAIEILLVGFAAKLVVMLAKYIIGWIPGVDG